VFAAILATQELTRVAASTHWPSLFECDLEILSAERQFVDSERSPVSPTIADLRNAAVRLPQ